MTARQCVCCLQTDGFRGGVEVDPSSGLCLYCQPCPECGETGGPCYEDVGVVCFGKRSTPTLAARRGTAETGDDDE